MTKLLVNLTKKIVYLLWLQNSGYIYSSIIITVNVKGKYSKSSFKIRGVQKDSIFDPILASVECRLFDTPSASDSMSSIRHSIGHPSNVEYSTFDQPSIECRIDDIRSVSIEY